MFLFKNMRRRFPIVTLGIMFATVFSYVLIGSGYEVNYIPGLAGYRLLAPLAFILHGSEQHITGNLVYFIPLSLLMESWLVLRKDLKTFLAWYLIPLFTSSLFISTRQFLSSSQFSFGLSFSIEAMTWALWAYILKNYHSILRRKVDVLMTIVSGIPSMGFFGWLYQYLFVRLTPYNKELADGHIFYGVITAILVFCLAFRSEIKNFIDTLKLRLLRSTYTVRQLFFGWTIYLRSLTIPILGVLFSYTFVLPLHEFGHWLIAYFDCAKILEVHWYYWYNKGKIEYPFVTVDISSFSSTWTLILHKSMGFIIIFLPFLFLLMLLKKRKSHWWRFAITVIAFSLWQSSLDFHQIGIIIKNDLFALITSYLFIMISIMLLLFVFITPGLKLLKNPKR